MRRWILLDIVGYGGILWDIVEYCWMLLLDMVGFCWILLDIVGYYWRFNNYFRHFTNMFEFPALSIYALRLCQV